MKSSWRVVALLCLVTGVAYLARTDITVAQERMAPALGLSMADMGAITAWAFQLSYALAQVPAGMLGERVGARQTLALALGGGAAASIVTGLMPETAADATLIGTRVLLGISQAAVFPVAAMAVAQFVAREHQMRANALHMASASLGSAIAPILMAPIMLQLGWRAVFLVSGALGSTAAIVFFTMMPRRAIIASGARALALADLMRDTRRLAANSSLRRLSLAYLLHSAVFFVFVFWFFRYLTEARGFTVLASGVWASLPSAAGFISGPLIGALADRYGRRVGEGHARRRAAMACLISATIMAILGAVVPGAFFAIAALSLSSASLNGAESPFFTTATEIGARNPGAAAGLLNLMGNLGGVLSIWLVPHMSDAWGWNGTLLFWAGIAFAAALLWLTVGTNDRASPSADADIALANA